jgi:hypothetical protein
MAQLKRDNHFVSQFYLKQWSKDGNRIWSYRILVSHKRIQEWKLRSIRGVAFHRDLYTKLSKGQEIDEFERWIETEFETPAQEVLDKVISDRALTTSDWERLALFFAAQDVRTPTSYLELRRHWKQKLPQILKSTLEKSVSQFEKARQENRTLTKTNTYNKIFKDSIKIQITPNTDPEKGTGIIRASMIVGRNLWLESQRFLLTKTANILKKHKWSIVEPAKGSYWFTSDHPVIRLNYGNGSYNLKGGWGNKGAYLLMPLSSRHLLFTRIGFEAPARFTFSAEKTLKIQQFIAERALRWIFALEPMSLVVHLRPRRIDASMVKTDEQQWRKWHKEQCTAYDK